MEGFIEMSNKFISDGVLHTEFAETIHKVQDALVEEFRDETQCVRWEAIRV